MKKTRKMENISWMQFSVGKTKIISKDHGISELQGTWESREIFLL